MLRAALPGALLGTPLGIAFVAPLASDLFIKLLFASMWCSFGLLHLRRINEITGYQGMTPHDKAFDHKVGFVVGFFGGLTIASITGVGIDMFLYMFLVLWCHADLKIAIPTSVIPASTPTRVASTRICIADGCGRCGSSPDLEQPNRPTRGSST